jgi:putative exporter of polyketide antibiotics
MDAIIFATYIFSIISVILSGAAFFMVLKLEENIKKEKELEKSKRR